MEIRVPAIKGEQAGSVVFQCQLTLADVVRFLQLTSPDLPIEDRYQRDLSETRAKRFGEYLENNNHKSQKTRSFIIPALTASLDLKPEQIRFEQIHEAQPIGILAFPVSAQLILNDGQHRRRGIEIALENDESFASHTVGVMLIVDPGLKRAQQIFSDINKNAKPVSNSLSILFDARSPEAATTKNVVNKVSIFKRYTEKEKYTLSSASNKLFTYSNLHICINRMFDALQDKQQNALKNQAIIIKYWELITKTIPQWKQIDDRLAVPKDIKAEFICTHAVAVETLARIGAEICCKYGEDSDRMEEILAPLGDINWGKENPDWEGKVVIVTSKGSLTSRNNNDAKSWLAYYLREKLGLEPQLEVQSEDAIAQNNQAAMIAL
jgi:DNA sulfur modification protein DndB